MTDTVYIEPAHEHRPAFAAWGLAQTPPLQTASAQGWDVPLDLYPEVPPELLDGAFVDGYRYAVPMAQPVALAAEAPQEAPPQRKRTTSRKPRKRAVETPVTPPVTSSRADSGSTGTASDIDGDTPGWGADA